ncbi:hypothetical protein [Paenibacillus sinensis]|nr:hypothetical protein [Paenibacillus sinensis]
MRLLVGLIAIVLLGLAAWSEREPQQQRDYEILDTYILSDMPS